VYGASGFRATDRNVAPNALRAQNEREPKSMVIDRIDTDCARNGPRLHKRPNSTNV
jgi:hypothetical protein